ncbi:hypothetical protein B7755_040950 [Streptomyces sp. NBS 14/10]|uniref:hypothetical protein n=1 Tax=Streptomyces sp. NBS 14/10 TaxID=1945643 RepID=UPI000B7FF578|nr:hypothetical protein [Streptomyces sp. NBS 14/10]KAK1183926.1 hypothetical protein B7755_040950 [Streptomyces sp. NBS 14/10]NUS89293.1 hypothetical protein [Streptomyces sp.]
MTEDAGQRWRWEYEPDYEYVAKGLPKRVVVEVERLAGQLVDLAEMGIDVTAVGDGPRPGVAGGVRRLSVLEDGFMLVLPLPRLRLVAVTYICPPFADL